MPPQGYEPFLKAICDDPDADLPRLVYADWLDEKGGSDDRARAEYIRVQCELARLPGDDPRVEALARREAEIARSHLHHWRQELPVTMRHPYEFPHGDYRTPFRRGFIEEAWLRGARWLTPWGADWLWDYAPVRRVVLYDCDPNQGSALARCECLGRLREFELSGNSFGPLTDEAARPIVQSRHLTALEELALDQNAFTDELLVALTAAPVLRRLKRLRLRSHGFTEAGFDSLLGSSGAAGFRVKERSLPPAEAYCPAVLSLERD